MRDDNGNSILTDSDAARENETRLALLYEIGRILATSETLTDAAPPLLEAVCRCLRFDAGELWLTDKNESVLELNSVRHSPAPPSERFAAESRALKFAVGEDLPGAVWQRKAPVWIENLSGETNLARQPNATRAGMRSAFAFPILLGEKFLGAGCFFSEIERSPDAALMQIFVAVGGNIGQFIERERAKRHLRESEENFRAFVQASSQAIWTTDAEGQNLEAFGWWENQTGQTRAESAGAGFLEAMHPDDRARARDVWRTAISTVKSFETECRIADRRGAYQHFALRGVPVFNADDTFRQWIGTLTDISDRKLAEQSLKDNEERYRALVEATSTVVWRATPDGELSFVGSFWETVSGQRVAEILGAGWLDAIHPDDRARTIKVWQDALTTKNIYETEFRVRTASGEYRWFAVRGVPILNPAGDVREWVGANTDVHERKLAEEKMRESDAVLETINQSSPTLIYLKDRRGRMLNANPATLEVVGKTLSQVLGKTHSEYTGDETEGAAIAENDRRIIEHGATETFEEIVLTKGSRHTFLSTKTPYRSERGDIIGLVGVGFDITLRKQAESRLALLADISELTRTHDDVDELLFAVSKKLGEHLRVRRCLFNEIDLASDTATVHRDYCRGVASVAGAHRISDYSSVTSAEMTRGTTVVNRDSEIDARTADDYEKIYEPNGERAYVAVPLLRENEWVASLWASDDVPREWSEQEISLLETVAERTWTAIEKLRVDADLRRSEERYRTLFETMDEGFCLCEMLFDRDGAPFDYRFLEVNPVFETMTGLKDAVGKTALELIPDLEPRWFEIYGRVALTGEPIRFTDGSEAMNRWFDVHAARVGGADSRKFTLLFADITTRKRTETALKESQQHLALALKIGRAGTFEWDIKNNVNRWSPEIEAMYGVPVGTFEGDYEGWRKRLVPEDAEAVEQGIQRALEKKLADYEYEFRVILPDAAQRWFAGRARFDYDESGEPRRMTGINVDVTTRKLTEIALSDARARLESTLTAGEIGTWLWDVANDAVFADKNLARMFSVSEADANGGKIENYIRAVHPEDRARVGAIIAETLRNGDDYEADYRLVSPKGNVCWVVARGTVERDADGAPVSLPGVVLDITARKEAEFERELLFVEAQKARETAERANQAKDEFIALVSHELRSPLNAMLGWTRILQKKKADEKTSDYALDVIIRNALSQSRLIEDLLDIARLNTGKLRIELAPLELAPIINAAVESVRLAAEAKNIKLGQTLDRAANFITGDGDRLRQVFENLLSNAVKFTPDGGSVSVSLECGGEKARIVVSDTGQGISPEFLPQIFERFKQADPSTTRRHGGLGIGLSLARDLVELHGGAIAARSAGENRGSTFTVTLPLRIVAPILENTGKVKNMDSQGKLSGFWILAVDDEADAREIISFMLQINGARVTSANSAVEALEILKNAEDRIPDILLSDISMPFESGYALLEKIRALPREHGGQIPAVALTAFNRPEDREAAFEAGFQKHLGKPVDMDALIDAIVETANAKHA